MKHKKILIIMTMSIISLFVFASCSFGISGDEILNGMVGLLTWIPRALVLFVFEGANNIITSIANSAGGSDIEFLTTEMILKNRVPITSIDFFTNANTDILNSIRANIAGWYYTLRNLAIACSTCTLIYLAIRMALSTTAIEKATYKTYITSWVISFILIFTLQFIIVGVIELNNQLAGMFDLDNIFENSTEENVTLEDVISRLHDDALIAFDEDGVSMAATIAYAGIIYITGVFLYIYLYRMVIVAFLIIISPLVTITYAIDRGQGKNSQSLNNWLKEFIFAIIIQPVHLLLYSMLIPVALNVISNDEVAGCIVMVFMLVFIWKAEGIIKAVFGIKSSSMKSGEDASKAMRDMYTVPTRGAAKIAGWGAKTLGAVAWSGTSKIIHRVGTDNSSNSGEATPSDASSTSVTNASAGRLNAANSIDNATVNGATVSPQIIQAASQAGAQAGARAGSAQARATLASNAGATSGDLDAASTSNSGEKRKITKKATTFKEAKDKLSIFKGIGFTEQVARAATGQPPKIKNVEKMATGTVSNVVTAGKLTSEAIASIGRRKEQQKEIDSLKAQNRKLQGDVTKLGKSKAKDKPSINRPRSNNNLNISDVKKQVLKELGDKNRGKKPVDRTELDMRLSKLLDDKNNSDNKGKK